MDIGSILGALIGIPHSPAHTAPDAMSAPPATVAPPVSTPQAIAPAPQSYTPSPQDIEVMGDRWKPRERKPLETVADLLIGAPIFTKHIKRENMESAMQGFDENPIRSIRRVAKINPEAAWTMYNQYHDNQIQDKIIKRQEDDETLGRGIGLLGVATEKNYPQIKQRVEQYWQNKGYDPGMKLPDEYDPEQIQGFREGALKAKEQLDYESMAGYRKQRLDQFQSQILNDKEYKGKRLNQFDRTITNTQAYRQQRLKQLQEGNAETRRHHETMEGNVLPQPGARELSPDKTVMREFGQDGQWHIFKKVNGKIQEVGVLAPTKQGGSKYDPEDYADTPVDDENDE